MRQVGVMWQDRKCLAERWWGLSFHHSLFWQEGDMFSFSDLNLFSPKPEKSRLLPILFAVTIPQFDSRALHPLKGERLGHTFPWVEVGVLRLPSGTCFWVFFLTLKSVKGFMLKQEAGLPP